MLKHSLAIYAALTAIPAHAAKSDVFMLAVGFALTGSDNADPVAIDRDNCVFKVKDETFHLNNVHTDRIRIQAGNQLLFTEREYFVRVTLHGDETVYEVIRSRLVDDGSDFIRDIKEKNPELFRLNKEISKEHTLKLPTDDYDRVVKAWTYIYTHGCSGKKSPF